MKKLKPEEAWLHIKALWPTAISIEQYGLAAIIDLGKGSRVTSILLNDSIDWGGAIRYQPSPEIRPYTFHEIVGSIARGHDETCCGYIVGINHNYVTFKKNDITETRALSDTSDITWADGKPFGQEVKP